MTGPDFRLRRSPTFRPGSGPSILSAGPAVRLRLAASAGDLDTRSGEAILATELDRRTRFRPPHAPGTAASPRRRAIGVTHLWLLLAALVFLVAIPAVDLRVESLFWSPQLGFVMAGAPWERMLYKLVPVLAGVATLGSVGVLLVRRIRRRPMSRRSRVALLMLTLLAVGPGLVVNGGLKSHWGRARPRDVLEFGGTRRFTPALVIADQCSRNCSFSAGDPAVAFSLAALSYLFVSRRKRLVAFGAAMGLGTLVGFGRMAAGAHFLSDVVASGLVVLGLLWFLAAWIVEAPDG